MAALGGDYQAQKGPAQGRAFSFLVAELGMRCTYDLCTRSREVA